jgi:hypothetical protein
MKRAVLITALLAGCDPVDFDFDLDLSGLEAGPIHGQYDQVTFSLVDGCPDGDFLFGCPKTMPTFAVGAHARIVMGSTSGEAADDDKLATATFKSSNAHAATAARDADGFVVIDALAEGATEIEVDDADGTLIDQFYVEVERIAWLEGDDYSSRVILEGARLAASVLAHGTSGRHLFAHGAVVATLSDMDLDADPSGFFMKSDMVVIRTAPIVLPPNGNTDPTQSTDAITRQRPARIEWTAGKAVTDVDYTVVTREELTSAYAAELWHEPGAYKQTLHAEGKIGDTTYVRGGPVCDWRIVSGGGDGAAVTSGVGDDTHSDWAFYDIAVVYGTGDMTVECRVNDRVAEQVTVHLGP